MMMQGETIPKETNFVSLSDTEKDEWGIPLLKIKVEYDENDEKIMRAAFEDSGDEAATGQDQSNDSSTGQAGFGETAGQDEEIADTAVGRLANRVEDGIGAYDDNGEVNGWVDCADRCHGFVSEDRPASGIDRNDTTAISGLAQHLHDGAAGQRTVRRAEASRWARSSA